MQRTTVPKLAKLILCLLGPIPFLWIVVGLLWNRLGVSPVDTITASTGHWGMRFLVASLSVTPLARMIRGNGLSALRRILGLFAFFYVCLHLLTFVGLDYFFNFRLMIADAVTTPHILVGLFTFLSLIPLAITSFRWGKKHLGQRGWKRLHSLVYASAAGAVAHYFLQVKIIPLDLIIYGSLVMALLGFRIVHFIYSSCYRSGPQR